MWLEWFCFIVGAIVAPANFVFMFLPNTESTMRYMHAVGMLAGAWLLYWGGTQLFLPGV